MQAQPVSGQLARHPKIAVKEDLPGHRFIGYSDDLLCNRDLRFVDEFHPALEVNFRTSTVMAQMKAVKAGAGIGGLPCFMAHGAEGLAPVLPAQHIERSCWLQVNPDAQHIARGRAWIDFIVDQIQSETDPFLSLPEG